jgi:hypothetical protein
MFEPFFLILFSGIIPLRYFKSSKAQAVICLGSGAGGLAGAAVWFYNWSTWNALSSSSGSTLEYDQTTGEYNWTYGQVDEANDSRVASVAMFFLIFGMLICLI